MADRNKTKAKLVNEMEKLRGQLGDLERSKLLGDGTSLQEADPYRVLAETVQDLVVLWGMDLVPVYISPSIEKLLGYTVEDVVSILKDPSKYDFSWLVMPESLNMLSHMIQASTKEDVNADSPQWQRPLRLELFKENGSTIWTETNISFFRNDAGKRIGFVSVTRDITERKCAEDKLLESEERYRTIFNNTGAATIIIEEDGIVSLANTEFEKLSGYLKEEVQGVRGWMEFVAPADLERLMEYDELRKSGSNSAPRQYEFGFVSRNGDIRDVLLTVALIPNSTQIVVSLSDITESKQAQAALAESQERYGTILEEMEDGYFEVNLNGDFTFINDSIARLLRYDKKELIGMNYRAYTTEECANDVFEKFHQVYATGEPLEDFSWEVIRKDGEPGISEATIFPLRNKEGDIIGFRGIGRDATKRKQAERELRESEERYRTIFNNTGAATMIVEGDTTISLANSEFEKLSGYGKEEVEGEKSWVEFVAPEDLERLKKYHELRRKEDGSAPRNYEFRFVNRQHEVRDVLLTVALVPGTQQSVISLSDITESKQALETLAESQERYGTILEEMEDGYFEVDLNGDFTFINDSMARLLRYDKEELIGMNYRAYTTEAYINDVFEKFHQVYATGEPLEDYSWDVIRKDGEQGISEATIFPLRDKKGDIVGFRGIGRDATKRKQAERELRESEERYRTIFNNTGAATMIVEGDTTISLANSEFEKLSGYGKEEVEGEKSWTEFVAPEDLERLKEYHELRRKENGSAPRNYEFRFLNREGALRDVFLTVALIPGTQQSVISLSDITESKRAQAALAQSKERYRTILEEMEDGYFEVDLSGNFTCFNDSMERLLGYTKEEMEGMNYRIYTAGESADDVFVTFHTIYVTGEAVEDYSWDVVRKNGEHRISEATILPLRNQEGEIIGFRGIGRDATERKRAEQALRESEEKYRTILESIEDGYFEIDLTGNFMFFNDSMCRILGYDRSEMMGMNNRQYMDAENAAKIYGVFNSVYKTGKTNEGFDWEVMRRNGERRQIESSMSLMRDEEEHPIGFRGVVRDVTERKRAEELHRIIANTSRAGVYIVQEGEFIYVNPKFSEYVGYLQEEMMGMESLGIVCSSDRKTVKANAVKMLKGEEVLPYEYRVVDKDGNIRWLLETVTSINYKGKPAVLGNSMDITEMREAREKLEEMKALESSMLSSMPHAVFGLENREIIFVNDNVSSVFGWDPDELIGQSIRGLYRNDDEFQRAGAELYSALEQSPVVTMELDYPCLRNDGRQILCQVTASRIGDSLNGRKIVATYADITERRRAEDALRESEEKYRNILESIEEGYLEIDLAGNCTFLNDAMCRILGYERHELLGMNSREYTTPETAKELSEIFEGICRTGESVKMKDYEVIRKNGAIRVLAMSASLIRDLAGNSVGFRGLARDITERKQAEKKLAYMATHDQLTDLPNRVLFNDRLALEIAHAKRNKKKLAVVLFDLDRFKNVNDTLGHDVGDKLLQAVSKRLMGLLRQSDTIARMGGDEFLMLFPEMASPGDLEKIIRKILDSFHVPFHLDGHKLYVTTSMGAAIYPEDGETIATLIKNADTAMYCVKETGRDNFLRYDKGMTAKLV